MAPNHVRFRLFSLMVFIALVALNVSGAIATSKFYPRPVRLPAGLFIASGATYSIYRADGTIEYGDRYSRDSGIKHVRRGIKRIPPRPTLLRIWAPVIAGATITLAALAIWVVLARRANRAVADEDAGVSPAEGRAGERG